MRLTLPRALILSVLLHVAFSHALLTWIPPSSLADESGPPLMFRLVEPGEAAAEEPDPPGRESPQDADPGGNVPAHAALAAGGTAASGGPAAGTAVPERRGDDGGEPRAREGGGAPAPEKATPPQEDAPGSRAGPAMQIVELERRLELDGADLSAVGLGRLQPLLARWAEHPGRRSASSYRELLRTYIDVLMGRPYPVVDWLRRHPIRYLAELQVAVDATGRFRFAEIHFYPNLPDDDGRVRGYYRRVLRQVADRPFLPPADAGLPAPHRLTYRLVNPETR